MNELIRIQTKGDHQLVSARELHKGLGLTTRFSKWVDQNFYQFVEGEDFTSVTAVTVVNNGARKPIQDYVLTIDMAKELCMMSKAPKGREVRKYFIQVEKNWNSPEMVMHRALEFSNQRVKQLQLKNQKLLEENFQQKAENQKLIETNAKQAEKIEQDKDDVLFSHAIRTADRAISIRELSVLLTQNGFKIGQHQLFALLRQTKYLSSMKSTWNLPNIARVKSGYFRVVHKVSYDGVPYRQTLVTVKGQKHIITKALRGKFDDVYNKIVASGVNRVY